MELNLAFPEHVVAKRLKLTEDTLIKPIMICTRQLSLAVDKVKCLLIFSDNGCFNIIFSIQGSRKINNIILFYVNFLLSCTVDRHFETYQKTDREAFGLL